MPRPEHMSCLLPWVDESFGAVWSVFCWALLVVPSAYKSSEHTIRNSKFAVWCTVRRRSLDQAPVCLASALNYLLVLLVGQLHFVFCEYEEVRLYSIAAHAYEVRSTGYGPNNKEWMECVALKVARLVQCQESPLGRSLLFVPFLWQWRKGGRSATSHHWQLAAFRNSKFGRVSPIGPTQHREFLQASRFVAPNRVD